MKTTAKQILIAQREQLVQSVEHHSTRRERLKAELDEIDAEITDFNSTISSIDDALAKWRRP